MTARSLANLHRIGADGSAVSKPGDQVPKIKLVPRPRRWRWITGLLIVGCFGLLINSFASNQAFEWPVVGEYFFNPIIMRGLWLTLWLTSMVTITSLVFGTLIATMRLSDNPFLSGTAWIYVWVFRSVPLLVLLLFWFNIAYLYPELIISIPFGPTLFESGMNDLITPVTAAFIALSLHEVAYASEFIRGGVLSVDQGQHEAGDALGLGRIRIFLRIVLPQAMRSIIPAAGNLLIMTLKSTSIVSVIATPDLLYAAQFIYQKNYKVLPLLMVATIWYAIVISILSVIQHHIEAYFARGTRTRATAED